MEVKDCKIKRFLGSVKYVISGFFQTIFMILIVSGCLFLSILGMAEFIRDPAKAKKFVYGLDYEERIERNQRWKKTVKPKDS